MKIKKIKSAIRTAGFEVAKTGATAKGRASTGVRVAITEGSLVETHDDHHIDLVFTNAIDATKENWSKVLDALYEMGLHGKRKVLCMDKASETFFYFVEVK